MVMAKENKLRNGCAQSTDYLKHIIPNDGNVYLNTSFQMLVMSITIIWNDVFK